MESSLSSVSLHDRRMSSSSLPPHALRISEADLNHSGLAVVNPAELSADDIRSSSDSSTKVTAKRRLHELQRQVNRLTKQALRPPRRGSSPGSLYQIRNKA